MTFESGIMWNGFNVVKVLPLKSHVNTLNHWVEKSRLSWEGALFGRQRSRCPRCDWLWSVPLMRCWFFHIALRTPCVASVWHRPSTDRVRTLAIRSGYIFQMRQADTSAVIHHSAVTRAMPVPYLPSVARFLQRNFANDMWKIAEKFVQPWMFQGGRKTNSN